MNLSFMTQLPPSYDQVIHEKTQEEHVVRPVAAPRRFSCTTSATQTDPVRVESHAKKKTAGKAHYSYKCV